MGQSVGKTVRTVTIGHKQGLHLSPASVFAEKAKEFSAEILVYQADTPDEKWNGKRVIELMSIGAVFNSQLVIEANGDDAEKAVDILAQLVEDNFGLK
jgi:phosphotransferase system HPr (HPr) family protein